MASSVYWIHHPEHTDMFAQGYIGVSARADVRFEEHRKRATNPHLKNAIKKYGWDTLIKKVIIIADEAYCLAMETKLRAEDAIGWNIVKGGGKPPLAIGNKFRLGIAGWSKGKKLTEEHCKNLSDSHKGQAAWNKGKKGSQVAWNKGIPMSEESKAKLSQAKLGKTHSMETRKKMSQAHLKRKQLGANHG